MLTSLPPLSCRHHVCLRLHVLTSPSAFVVFVFIVVVVVDAVVVIFVVGANVVVVVFSIIVGVGLFGYIGYFGWYTGGDVRLSDCGCCV